MLFVWMVVAVATASALHELTHYMVARLLGRRATFSVLDWAVYHESPAGGVTAGDWLVQGAPVLAGVLVLPVLVYVWPVHPAVVVAWVFYSFVGAATNDFEFEHADTDGESAN